MDGKFSSGEIKVGDWVKWRTMFDTTMCGVVRAICFDTIHATRVDGGVCSIARVRCDHANPDDVLSSCAH